MIKMSEEWTVEKDVLRKQLNNEYAKLQRDKTRKRKYGPKPKSLNGGKETRSE